MKKEKVIILFSGGLDSTLLVKMAQAAGMEPYCLMVDYGQRHKAELDFGRVFAEKNKLKYKTISIQGFDVHSKLLDGVTEFPGVSEWHVPSRNLLFISLAASFAESLGISLIWYGANLDDRENHFPDCYQDWVYKVNQVLTVNGSKSIRLEAPLLGLNKPTIQKIAKEMYNIKKEDVFSGYGDIK